MSRWRGVLAGISILALAAPGTPGSTDGAAPPSLDRLAAHLRERALPPADYVLARLADHRVVLLG